MDKHITIFIVEDDKTYARLLKFKLENEHPSFQVTTFGNGDDFLAQMNAQPDIVVLDYILPEKSGLDVLKIINRQHEHIFTILLSAQEEMMVVIEAYRNGAKDYIVKGKNAVFELTNSVKNLSKTIQLSRQIEQMNAHLSAMDLIEKQKNSIVTFNRSICDFEEFYITLLQERHFQGNEYTKIIENEHFTHYHFDQNKVTVINIIDATTLAQQQQLLQNWNNKKDNDWYMASFKNDLQTLQNKNLFLPELYLKCCVIEPIFRILS